MSAQSVARRIYKKVVPASGGGHKTGPAGGSLHHSHLIFCCIVWILCHVHTWLFENIRRTELKHIPQFVLWTLFSFRALLSAPHSICCVASTIKFMSFLGCMALGSLSFSHLLFVYLFGSLFVLSWDRVPCSPDCPWIFCVPKDDLALLILLPVSPWRCDHRHVPLRPVCMILG